MTVASANEPRDASSPVYRVAVAAPAKAFKPLAADVDGHHRRGGRDHGLG